MYAAGFRVTCFVASIVECSCTGVDWVAHPTCLLLTRSSRLLHSWALQDDGVPGLVPVCSHAGHVLALYLDTRGDFVVVGTQCKYIALESWKIKSPFMNRTKVDTVLSLRR